MTSLDWHIHVHPRSWSSASYHTFSLLFLPRRPCIPNPTVVIQSFTSLPLVPPFTTSTELNQTKVVTNLASSWKCCFTSLSLSLFPFGLFSFLFLFLSFFLSFPFSLFRFFSLLTTSSLLPGGRAAASEFKSWKSETGKRKLWKQEVGSLVFHAW